MNKTDVARELFGRDITFVGVEMRLKLYVGTQLIDFVR